MNNNNWRRASIPDSQEQQRHTGKHLHRNILAPTVGPSAIPQKPREEPRPRRIISSDKATPSRRSYRITARSLLREPLMPPRAPLRNRASEHINEITPLCGSTTKNEPHSKVVHLGRPTKPSVYRDRSAKPSSLPYDNFLFDHQERAALHCRFFILKYFNVRPLGSTSVRSFDQTDARLLSLPDVRQLGLNRSATRLNDVRTLGLNRSTIRLIDVRQLGLDRSAFLIDVRIKRPAIILNNVRPLALKSFGHSDPQAFAHSTKLMLAHWSSMTFGVLTLTVRPIALIDVPQFQHEAFQNSFSRPFGLERSALRSSLTFGGHQRFVHAEALKTGKTLLDLNTRTINRSTIHVHERSKGYTPSGSCSPKNTQTINRSTIHVHERSKGYTPSGSCSPKNTQTINRLTIHVHGRSTLLIFGLSTSKVFVPLASTARQSLIHGLKRSSIRPFDATDVVRSASMTFVRLASIIRPHMPLGLYRP
ncbi:hypothetical protein LR48_Vigan03g251000 [Vigna angularis]|uniref:Uncharacterized protein n=1 Tax=Phaseolus angularis TaxID=3914 RepID=A0A0L9U8M5_PHAAN|nr:hypothetical protein LR48_Vigan03g251000 [Vigna angularis]